MQWLATIALFDEIDNAFDRSSAFRRKTHRLKAERQTAAYPTGTWSDS